MTTIINKFGKAATVAAGVVGTGAVGGAAFMTTHADGAADHLLAGDNHEPYGVADSAAGDEQRCFRGQYVRVTQDIKRTSFFARDKIKAKETGKVEEAKYDGNGQLTKLLVKLDKHNAPVDFLKGRRFTLLQVSYLAFPQEYYCLKVSVRIMSEC